MTKKQLNKVRKMMKAIENKKVCVVEKPLFRSPLIPENYQFISSTTVNPDGLCCFKLAALKALGITEAEYKPEKEVSVRVYCKETNTCGAILVPEHVAKYMPKVI